jgi:tellurite resistance protein
MFRRRERKRAMERQIELTAMTLQGFVDAGILMAAADGEITTEEYDQVADVISGFLDGKVSNRDIRAIINEAVEMLEEQGYDARLEALNVNLVTEELREVAFQVACAVLVADGEYGEDDEGEAYDDIADALEIDQDRAQELFDEVGAIYAD